MGKATARWVAEPGRKVMGQVGGGGRAMRNGISGNGGGVPYSTQTEGTTREWVFGGTVARSAQEVERRAGNGSGGKGNRGKAPCVLQNRRAGVVAAAGWWWVRWWW